MQASSLRPHTNLLDAVGGAHDLAAQALDLLLGLENVELVRRHLVAQVAVLALELARLVAHDRLALVEHVDLGLELGGLGSDLAHGGRLGLALAQ